jgi:hypothetical protein
MNRARHTNDKLQTFDWGDIKCPSYVENVPTHFGNVATLVGTSLLQTHVNSLFRRVGVVAFSSSFSSFVKIYPQ